MDDTGAIAKALAAFQAEMPVVPKSSRANAGTYSYTYAGLADILDLAIPILSKHGLAFTALPAATDRGFVLTGVLLHESGERLEGTLPISGNRPQEIGSSLTYARRYLFTCMTGLVTDDDDDGVLAQKAERTRLTHDTPTARETGPIASLRGIYSADQPAPDDPLVAGLEAQVAAPMTDNTRKQMFAEFGKHKVPEDVQLAGINALLGTDYTSRGDLTETHAKLVIADLKRRTVTA